MREITVPGDKSIAHRFLMLATLAEGASSLSNVSGSLDVLSTAACLRAIGATVEEEGRAVLRVSGPEEWRVARAPLDCGNSGTTARLLAGLMTGLGLEGELTGDSSLRRRPMDRVVYPLQAMGGRIRYLDRPDRLPVRIEGRASGGLRPLRYRPRVSSAQVRAALLLAAVTARVDLEIVDRQRPRDHTERILSHMGAPVRAEPEEDGERVQFSAAGWDGRLSPLRARVPGDVSAALFLVVAALLGERELTLRSVGLNPSRIAWVSLLQSMGAVIETRITGFEAGEPVGDLLVRPAALTAFEVGEREIPGLIDEIPALAVLASRQPGVTEIRGAGELRVKESDRLAFLVRNFVALGVHCEELEDGLRIHGDSRPLEGFVRTGGDHRIAMAFGALGASPGCRIEVDDPDCVAVSFPDFWAMLGMLQVGGRGA